MTEPIDLGDDDQLMNVLRDALRGEAAIEMAFALRDVEAQLAEQIEDTALDFADSGVRNGVGTDRTVTFQHGEMMVEVSIDEATGDVYGQFLPAPEPGLRIELDTPGWREVVVVDDLGRFSVHTDAQQLRLRFTGESIVVLTPWIFR